MQNQHTNFMGHQLEALKINKLIDTVEQTDNNLYSIDNNSIIIVEVDENSYNFFLNERSDTDINDIALLRLNNILEFFLKKDYIESFTFKTLTGHIVEKTNKTNYLSYSIKNLCSKYNFKINLKKNISFE